VTESIISTAVKVNTGSIRADIILIRHPSSSQCMLPIAKKINKADNKDIAIEFSVVCLSLCSFIVKQAKFALFKLFSGFFCATHIKQKIITLIHEKRAVDFVVADFLYYS